MNKYYQEEKVKKVFVLKCFFSYYVAVEFHSKSSYSQNKFDLQMKMSSFITFIPYLFDYKAGVPSLQIDYK